MWRRGNAPVFKDKGQWLESRQDLFFFVVENCPLVKKSLSDFCLSAFFVGFVTAAPHLPKGWDFLSLITKNFLVYSGFGQVIEFQQFRPIFFFEFVSCCSLKNFGS